MPYSSTDKRITAKPVGLGDIKNAIHSFKKRLNNLCVSPLVNKWSKYKPINNKGVSTAIETGTNYRGEAVNGVRTCGLNVTPVNTISLALSRAKGGDDWEYTRRTDGPTYPHRYNDFLNYFHGATCFMKSFSINVTGMGNEIPIGETDVTFSFDCTGGGGYSLAESDFEMDTQASGRQFLSNWLKGMIFEEISNDAAYSSVGPFVLSGNKITENDLALLGTGGYRTSRTFKIYPVYLRNAESLSTAMASTNKCVPMNLPPLQLKLMPSLGQLSLQDFHYENGNGINNLIQLSLRFENQRLDTMTVQFSNSPATYTLNIYGYTNPQNATLDYEAGTFNRADAVDNSFSSGSFVPDGVFNGTFNESTLVLNQGGSGGFYVSEQGHFALYTGITPLVSFIAVGQVQYKTGAGATKSTNQNMIIFHLN